MSQAVAVLAACCCVLLSAGDRETVLDRVEFVEPELQEVPIVPPLCDAMDVWKRHVCIGDCSLYCEKEGEGPPLVLLHGGPGSTHHLFHPHFSAAARFATAIYYDQRGCGFSQYKDGSGYSIQQAADDLDKLRAALGYEKWVILGSSYGGMLAQCYTLNYPDRVAGLVLVGSAFKGLPIQSGSREGMFITEAERARIDAIYNTNGLPMEQQVFNAHLNGDWKRQSFHRPTRDQLARMALYEWQHDENFRGDIGSSLGGLDYTDVFEDCPIPILLMEGKWDLTWEQDKAQKLHACFPGSKLVVFPQSGHCPYEDEPDAFFTELETFVGRLQDVPEIAVKVWKRKQAERRAASTAAEPVAEAVFTSEGPAPEGFTWWTFHWTMPAIDPDAQLKMIVLTPDGQEYASNTITSRSSSVRSDFSSEWGYGDVSVFYNKPITVKFTVDKGGISFPRGGCRFEFHTGVAAAAN